MSRQKMIQIVRRHCGRRILRSFFDSLSRRGLSAPPAFCVWFLLTKFDTYAAIVRARLWPCARVLHNIAGESSVGATLAVARTAAISGDRKGRPCENAVQGVPVVIRRGGGVWSPRPTKRLPVVCVLWGGMTTCRRMIPGSITGGGASGTPPPTERIPEIAWLSGGIFPLTTRTCRA